MLALSTLILISEVLAIFIIIFGMMLLVIGDQFAKIMGLKLLSWGIVLWVLVVVATVAIQAVPQMMQGT